MKPNKPYLVGLTGGIACGKSNLSAALNNHGAKVIDADKISRALTAPGGAALPLLRKRFGPAIFSGDALDRQALSALVFGREEALAALNALMHPLIFNEMDRQLAAYVNQSAVVADVPLLYETGYDRFCDEVWCAWAPEETQIARLEQRGLSRQQAMQRINSQMPALEKAQRADRVIVTTASKEESARAVIALWDALIGRINNV